MNRLVILFGLVFLLNSNIASATEIKAGAAKILITPITPMWLTGYAGREKPATDSLRNLGESPGDRRK
jgi:hypothetical protein